MSDYIQKQAFTKQLIHDTPNEDLGIIVVIPSFNEPDLIRSLSSLNRSGKPNCAIEVIIVINDSEASEEAIKRQNRKSFNEAQKWSLLKSGLQIKYFPIYVENLPKKHAGVGLARKIGMDEAVRRFESLGRNGVITSFDADSICAPNYFEEIHKHFYSNESCDACSIHYEHPIEGFDEAINFDAIILYELHLRYYVNALKYAGFQKAVQTVGSAIAVRSKAYQEQGGMSKRKAGEDFYFIHKFTPLGTFQELKTTLVIPSPRISDRVPFGTGKAVGEILGTDEKFKSYHPNSFKVLQQFIKLIPTFYENEDVNIKNQIPQNILPFLEQQDFEKTLLEIKSNSTSKDSFEKRFYRWFNAFRVMKLLHFLRDEHFENVAIEIGGKWLIEKLSGQEVSEKADAKDMLLWFRELDKK